MPASKSSGFTLIELLIVVAIIAILAAIAVPNFLEAQVRAKVSRINNDMRSMATALESYYVDQQKYPPSINPSTGSTFIPRIRSHSPLTTPIAYITTGLSDTFNTGEAAPPGFTTQDQRVLVYWGPDFLNELVTSGGTVVNQRPRTAIIFNEFGEVVSSGQVTREPLWAMISFSPDQDFDVLDSPRNNIGPNTTSGFPQQVQQYDPTNGTISDGDIVRFRQ